MSTEFVDFFWIIAGIKDDSNQFFQFNNYKKLVTENISIATNYFENFNSSYISDEDKVFWFVGYDINEYSKMLVKYSVPKNYVDCNKILNSPNHTIEEKQEYIQFNFWIDLNMNFKNNLVNRTILKEEICQIYNKKN